jgi:hypothetical protein
MRGSFGWLGVCRERSKNEAALPVRRLGIAVENRDASLPFGAAAPTQRAGPQAGPVDCVDVRAAMGGAGAA